MATALQVAREQRIQNRFYRMIHQLEKVDQNRQAASTPDGIRYWAKRRNALYAEISKTLGQL
jgi:hypothetical protein